MRKNKFAFIFFIHAGLLIFLNVLMRKSIFSQSNPEQPEFSETNKRLSRVNGDFLCFPNKGPLMLTYKFSGKPISNFIFELPLSIIVNEKQVIAYMTGLNLKYYPKGQYRGFFIGPILNAGVGVWSMNDHPDQLPVQ